MTTIEITPATREVMRETLAHSTAALLQSLAEELAYSPPNWAEAEGQVALVRENLDALAQLGWEA